MRIPDLVIGRWTTVFQARRFIPHDLSPQELVTCWSQGSLRSSAVPLCRFLINAGIFRQSAPGERHLARFGRNHGGPAWAADRIPPACVIGLYTHIGKGEEL